MKVAVIGKSSYIGSAFAQAQSGLFEISIVNARNDEWKLFDFSGVDAVLHCAAIAHRKQKKSMRGLYFSVNRDLTAQIAEAAKNAGVKQFIFLSTMSVYGIKSGGITPDAVPKPAPDDYYASSKYEAEIALRALEDENFRVAIVRPPMVYGDGCKGNYAKLEKLLKYTPVFPDFINKRSAVSIDNLAAFLAALIDESKRGIFTPQDPYYACTTKTAAEIADKHGRKLRLTSAFNPIIKFMITRNATVSKLFGDLYYE